MPRKHIADLAPSPSRNRSLPGEREAWVDDELAIAVERLLPTVVTPSHLPYRLAMLLDSLRQTFAEPVAGNHRANEKRALTDIAIKASELLRALDALSDDAHAQLSVGLQAVEADAGIPDLRAFEHQLRHLFDMAKAGGSNLLRRGPASYGPDDQALFQIGFTYEILTGKQPTSWLKTVPIENDPDPDRVDRRELASPFARFAELMLAHAGHPLDRARLRTAIDKYLRSKASS